jgi:hypothetical protein
MSGRHLELTTDLRKQSQRLKESADWLDNVAAGIEKASQSGRFEYTTTSFVYPDTTSVGIALVIGASDVPVMTIICERTDEEIIAMISNSETRADGLRLAQAKHWQKDGVRPLEFWFIPAKTIWQGSEAATEVLLTKTVREWLNHWFDRAPRAHMRPRRGLEFGSLGVRKLPAQPPANTETTRR